MDFRVSRHAEICQFDCFSLEINFERACSCNYGIPRLGSSKKMYYVSHEISSLYFPMLEVFQKCSLFTVGSIPLADLKFFLGFPHAFKYTLISCDVKSIGNKINSETDDICKSTRHRQCPVTKSLQK